MPHNLAPEALAISVQNEQVTRGAVRNGKPRLILGDPREESEILGLAELLDHWNELGVKGLKVELTEPLVKEVLEITIALA